MNHWNYILMAYGAFAVLMLWDYAAPRMALGRAMRAIRLKQRKGGQA
ncbi:MAG: heme exporter protein CcmD [Arenimonas sp.]